jgi:high-affinity iron transporter
MSRILTILFLTLLIGATLPFKVQAASAPGPAAEQIRSALVQAQLALTDETAQAQSLLATAQLSYEQALAPTLRSTDPAVDQQVQRGLADL